MTKTCSVSVLVVEPQPVLRLGLTMLFRTAPGVRLCGQAEESETALRMVAKLQPDIVLTELRLASGTGLEFLQQLKHRHPLIKTAVLTSLDESIYAERALAAGAVGFFSKNEEPDVLLDGLRDMMQGNIVASESVKQSLFSGLSAAERDGEDAAIAALSNRELQVFEMIGQGLSTMEIASQLDLSVKTVETYRSKLKQKLNIENSHRLSRYAMRWSLMSV